jgi:hypothetical protein
MKIEQLIKSKIERNYFFITGKVQMNTKYFIDEIEKGIRDENNKSFQTNLVSEMTDWKYFLSNKKFIDVALKFNDLVEQEDLTEGKRWTLQEAWGFKQSTGNYTQSHDHFPAMVSGAIMLNKHQQSLLFPEIKKELKCEPGNFVLFSSYLKHGSKRNLLDSCRYGLSFNYMNKFKN